MISYNLAKQLKDAGFPLIDSVGYAFNENKEAVANLWLKLNKII